LIKKFSVDAPKHKVVNALESLGFQVVRENPDGSKTPLTMPNHPKIKASTLRRICTQAGISRDKFLESYKDA